MKENKKNREIADQTKLKKSQRKCRNKEQRID